MEDISKFETVLIRDNTVLPNDLSVDTEPVFSGWKAVRNLDGYELGRAIHKANWNFFYLAGKIHAVVFGHKGQKTRLQAVKRIASKLQGKQFNCLEITSVLQKRFLGFPFVSVSANSRHIQESVYLVPLRALKPSMTAAAFSVDKLDNDETPHHGQVFPKPDVAPIGSL
ncbi:MAG: hypothetical protein WAK48_00335 [Candidatus Acidiferrum sp.]|jgi:hypothetical protein